MQATDTLQLHEAFVTAIRGIVPRYVHKSDDGDEGTWHYDPDSREGNIAGAKLRNFFLVTGPAAPLDPPLFYGQGESWGYELAVHVSYADVDDQNLDHMINLDARDLRGTFEGLYDPTVPGLYSAEYSGRTQEDIDDSGHVALAHLFAIIYNQED